MNIRAVIKGCGSYLPERVMTNRDLEALVDTSDTWIQERTGITQRHIAAEGEMTSDLAAKAARKAMVAAGIKAEDVDLVILATTTPDLSFPSTATKVQALLGITQGAAFDVQAVCSGFIYALSIANNFIRTGQAKTVLVIGAEILSRIVDWTDRGTCVLFGDGAGAVVLQAEDEKSGRGILSTHLHSDGRYQGILYVDGGVASTGTAGKIRMLGQEVYKHAVEKMSACVEEALKFNGLTTEDVDFLVPHQANVRILNAVARKLRLPEEKVVATVNLHANTSAASIPLALDYAVSKGKFKPGHMVVLEAIGGGLSWGSCLLRW